MTSPLLKEGVYRAALAVAIVFSFAVIIAVSDPRPSGSTSIETGVASATGRRIVAPQPAATTQNPQPSVAIEAAPTPVPAPAQSLTDVVAATMTLAGMPRPVVPAGGCASDLPIADGLPGTFQCEQGAVVTSSPGRVLMAVSSGEPRAEPPAGLGLWKWERALSLGNFVVIDHGATTDASSVITVSSNLTELDPAMTVGAEVAEGQRIGGLGIDGQQGPFTFGWEVWVDDSLPGIAAPVPPPAVDIALFQATELSPPASPVDSPCPFPAGDRESFPNAARAYRSGVHQGIDFGCGTPGLSAYSFDDGVVTMIVNNEQEPTTAQREAILQSAADAGTTPMWVLMMLYGNFVAVDHGDVPNVGRVVTIYSHLASIDPGIALGDTIPAGQRLGEVGASGTSVATSDSGASEADINRGIHLHWEVQIDNHYLAEAVSAAATEQVYRSLLCRANEALSCT